MKVIRLSALHTGRLYPPGDIAGTSVSQTVVRGPQVVLGFYPCGPFRLNISTKKTEKNKINVNCVSHTIVENLKQSLEITYNKRL